jgi:PAS domain-containing protein
VQRRELLRPRLATITRDQIIAVCVAMTVGVTLVATVVLASIEIGPEQARSEWPLWLSLTLLAALLKRVRTDLFGDGKVSLSFVPLFAIALIIGPVPTILTGATVGLVTHLRPGARPLQVVFNSAVLGAAPAAGSLLYHLLTEVPRAELAAEQSAAMAGAAVTAFILNTVTVAGVVSLSSRRSIRSVWVEKFLWASPHYVGLAVLAYLVALAFSELGFAGIAGFLLPITLYQLSGGQYVRRTRDVVLHLQQNEERFRALVQHAPGMITIVDRQGKGHLVTPDSQIAAHAAHDVMSQVHPDDADRVSALVNESIKQAGEGPQLRYAPPARGWLLARLRRGGVEPARQRGRGRHRRQRPRGR